MKNIYALLCCTLIGLICSCSSNISDEPEIPYDGPWIIHYEEYYYGLHNNSADFENWFKDNLQYFERAQFSKMNGTKWSFDSSESFPQLSDYNEWYMGEISWTRIIEQASENDIKSAIAKFESFSLHDKEMKIYDDFTASYKKYDK